MRKNIQKVLSAFLAIFLLLSSFGTSFVFAAEEIPVDFTFEVAGNEVMTGETFRINFALDFDAEAIAAAEGIRVFSCKIAYDAEVLDILDPNTMLPLEIGSNGKPIEGSFMIYGDLGLEDALSATAVGNGKISLLYATISDAADLFSPGPIAQFAFMAKSDLVINNSRMTSIAVENPIVTVNNNSYTPVANDDSVGIAILPQFVPDRVGSLKQNEVLRLSDHCNIGTESTEPLMISIIDREGNVIEEQQANVTTVSYSANFTLSEEKYAPGTYTIKYVYGDSTATTSFTLFEKAPELVIPPTDSDDESDDNTGGNESGNDGGNNNNNNNQGGGGAVDQPNKDTNEESPEDTEEPQDKPVVVYPSDIARHWAERSVMYAYDNKLMNGYEDGTFGVDNSITRAEFVTVISRLLGLEENVDKAADFADCNGHWANGYIGALAAMGIVGGVNDGEFAPDENITREQIAIILSRAFNLVGTSDANSFVDDAEISDWAKDGVYAVLNAGYMKGDEMGNFAPLANATRGEVATVIMRLHQGM